MGTRHKLLVLVPVFIVFVKFKVLRGGSFCRMPLGSSALYYILGVPVHKECNFLLLFFFTFAYMHQLCIVTFVRETQLGFVFAGLVLVRGPSF